MKKIITNSASKLLLAVMLLLTQFTAFASDGISADATKWEIVSSKPEFWIGVALFFVFISLYFIIGRNKNQQEA